MEVSELFEVFEGRGRGKGVPVPAGCYGKCSRTLVGYLTSLVTEVFWKCEICNDLQKCGLLGGSTLVGPTGGQLADRDLGENKARPPCPFQIPKKMTVNG